MDKCTMTRPLRIGTRGSPLAIWQANYVAEGLRAVAPDREVELVIIQTHGDQIQNKSLAQIGGDGVFTKAIQDALRDGRADLAVHSLKDLPTIPVPGMLLAAVPPRGVANDAFLSRRYKRFDDLPNGARVATGSQRRRALILHRRPDLELIDIRGNVETRVRKLKELDFDGLIMAQAGLERLGLDSEIAEPLDPAWMVPAVGQGALAIECRVEDSETHSIAVHLDHVPSRQAVTAERAFLLALGGGCQLPIAAAATVSGEKLSLHGVVLAPDGSRSMHDTIRGAAHQAEALGQQLAVRLKSSGAESLLRIQRES